MPRYSYIKLWGLALSLFFICSCHESKLSQALTLSGEHKTELQKVLTHYQNDPQKLEAAKWLIANMPGSYARNAELMDICQPFYQQYDALANAYHYEMTSERGKKIDSLWSKFSANHLALWQLPYQPDIQTLSAERLIAEIDHAFTAWQGNVHTRDGAFEEFCEYILPYRRMNGLVIDDARSTFYARHYPRFFTDPSKDIIDEADSLLFQYRHLTHSRFWGTQIPILNAATFEHMRHGLCEHRCWYNSILFSSLGVGAAVDFVPAWGNRNNSHTWNVLIKDGQSYAFESYWDNDRWKYKRIYNNETFDSRWGRFRLAKVYRHSFKQYIEGPIADKRVNAKDIPDLFRNIKKKDVSHEYFDAVDVTLQLTDIPKGAHYAYLCVFNFYEWQPIQWGKIEGDEVTFKGMGKDIVYLPCYYKNGSVSYAGAPFMLNKSGEVEPFGYDVSDTEDLYIKHYAGNPLYYGIIENIRRIGHTVISGSLSPAFTQSDTLCVLPEVTDFDSQRLQSLSDAPTRYLRVSLPEQWLSFSDLSFFYKDENGVDKKIVGTSFLHSLDSTENGEIPEYILDEYKATGYKKEVNKDYVDIDLGGEYSISSIHFIPYLEPGLKPHVTFELFYWHDGWKSLGKQKGATTHIVFNDVPKGALFMLKHENPKDRPGSRLFVYRENEVRWH